LKKPRSASGLSKICALAQLASGPKNLYATWPPSSAGGGSLGSWYAKKLLAWDAPRRLLAEHYCRTAGACDSDVVPPWAGIALLGSGPDPVSALQTGLQIWNCGSGMISQRCQSRCFLESTGRWQAFDR